MVKGHEAKGKPGGMITKQSQAVPCPEMDPSNYPSHDSFGSRKKKITVGDKDPTYKEAVKMTNNGSRSSQPVSTGKPPV